MVNGVFEYVVLPIMSLFLGFVGAWIVARYGILLGLIDMPNVRSSHCLPTPRGGGLGILAAFTISAIYLNLPVVLWLPASLLSLTGFFDDRLKLSLKIRLLLQFAAASAVIWLIVLYHSPNSLLGSYQYQLPAIASFLLFVFFGIFFVGTTNIYNFMDGINGIAGITGVIGFSFLAIFAFMQGTEPLITLLAACIAAACARFLPLNVPRARVFMGDGGSILLGFAFTSLSLALAHSLADFLLLCGFIFPFYADSLTTMYVRWRDGERLTEGHRRHLYQLLANQQAVPHWQVSLVYGVVQAVIGILLIWFSTGGLLPILLGNIFLLLIWCWAAALIRQKIDPLKETVDCNDRPQNQSKV